MRRLMMGAALAAASLLPGFALAGDQETAQHVAANMKNSGRLKGYSIDVKAKDGLVVLMGKVANDEQLSAAIEVAQQTPGVEQVVSQLSVTAPAASLPPAAMPARIDGGLRQPGASSEEIAPLAPVESSGRRRQPGFQPQPQMQTQSAVTSSYDAETSADAAAIHMNATPKPVPRSVQVSTRISPPMPLQAGQASPIYSQNQMQAPMMSGPPVNMPQNQPQPPYAMAARQPNPMPIDGGQPIPAYTPGVGGGPSPVRYDHPQMPNYSWPSYAAYPNYAAVTYPKQYSATAWPFIGPFYPYPQVPLGWRKVTLEWDDGWWFLDFNDHGHHCHR